MATAKYSKLATTDDEERMTFDFTSAFTFEERGKHQQNYKSAFTYGERVDSQYSQSQRGNDLEVERGSSDRFTWILVYLGYMVVYLMTFPVMVWFSFKRVKEGERMVVFRLGHMQKAKGPGVALVLPFLDRYHKKDVSLRAFSVPPKQVITGDKAIIEVGAEIYFQIVDVEKSVTNVQDLDRSTRILVQTALCNLLSQRDLADIESERRALADELMEKSNSTCTTWGVQITRAELSQIKVLSQPLPKQAPSVMMPPGLFGAYGGAIGAGEAAGSTSGLPSALAMLASSLTNEQGAGQTEAITQALHAMVAPHLNTDNSSDPATTTASLPTTPPSNTVTATSSPQQLAAAVAPLPVPPATVPMDPSQVLSMIRRALCEDVVARVQETFQVEISGAGAGTYFLDLCNGGGAILEGPDPTGDPSATLSMTFDDLQAMLQGQLKPYQAYMSGRLRVGGDMAATLKLEHLAGRVQSQMMVSSGDV